MGINYGLEKVRFPNPVKVGSRIRLGAKVVGVDEVPDNGVQLTLDFIVEIEGETQAGLRGPAGLPPLRLTPRPLSEGDGDADQGLALHPEGLGEPVADPGHEVAAGQQVPGPGRCRPRRAGGRCPARPPRPRRSSRGCPHGVTSTRALLRMRLTFHASASDTMISSSPSITCQTGVATGRPALR